MKRRNVLVLVVVFLLSIFASHAHADNPYLSNIEWGFDENETLYLKAHVEQDLPNTQVILTVGTTTITSGVYTLDGARIWYVLSGQNISAGQDLTFFLTLVG